MSISAFNNKAHQPTAAELFAALGEAGVLWDSVVESIEETYGLKGEWKFYAGPSYGWTFWFRKGGRTLVCLYPGQGSLTAQVVLSREQAEHPFAKRFTASLKMYPEGCWLFFKVTNARQAVDLRRLIAIKTMKAAAASGEKH